MSSSHSDRSDSDRRRALGEYTILDTAPDPAFDRIVRLAARFLDAPMATIGFVDGDRIWYKATHGVELDEHGSASSFCAETVERGELFAMNNPQEQARFAGHPLLNRDEPVRFYAGVPLTVEGPSHLHAPVPVGALAILDTAPRELHPDAIATLHDLAAITVDELNLRAAQGRANEILESITDAFFVLDPEWRFSYLNPQAEHLLQRSRSELVGRNVWTEFPAAQDSIFQEQYEKAVRENTTVQFEAFYEPLDTWFSVRAYPHANGLSVYFLDITERRAREERLTLMEETIEQASEAVLITKAESLDPPGPEIVYANPAFSEMTGYSIDEVLGKTPRLLQGPRTDEEELARLREHFEAGEPVTGETTNYRKDGTPYVVQWSIAPVHDNEGRITHWVSVQRDTTERREMENRLRERERRFRLLFEENPLPMWVYDLDTLRFRAVNHAAIDQYGYSEDKFLEMRLPDIRPEEDVGKLLDDLEAERPDLQHSGIWRHQLKDGTCIYADITSHLIHYGGRESALVVANNVTDRVETQRALQERERYLSVTLNSIGDAVIATDLDGCVTRMNTIAEQLTGWPRSEARGRPLQSIFEICNAHTRDPVENPVDEVLRHGKTVGLANHTVLIARDGTERQIADSAAPIRTADGELLGVVLVFRDVTERYKRQQALRESKLALEQAQKMTRTGNFILDVATNTVEFSEEAGRIFGLDPDEPHDADAVRALVHPDDQALAREASLQILRDAEPYDVEFRIQPAGRDTVQWVRGRGQPLPDETGSVATVFGTVSDITQQKEQESIIQRFGRLLDASVNEIYLFEADSLQFVQVNQGGRDNLGYAMEALRSMTPTDLKPYTRAEFEALIEPLRSGEEELITFETTHQRKDGSTYPVEVRLQLSRDETPPLFVAVVLDITDRKEAEEALRQSEERYRTLVERSHDAIYIYRGRQLLFVNQRTCELTGYSEEELYNLDVFELVHPEDRERVREHAIKRRKGQAPPRYEARLVRKDGTVRYGEFSVQAITYQGEYAAIGSIRDVTERKATEDALRAAKEEAEEMNRLKSAFLANMSHEIRTPLTSIIGFTEVLGEEDLGEVSRFIELIRRGGERLLDTLNSVLDLSQLEAGSMRLTPAPLDVTEEVRETVDLFKPRAAKHDVNLVVDAPERPLPAELDGAGLRRILSNLLSNATKFTEPGDQIIVRVTPEDNAFTLDVEDTGVGIDAEFLPHLFDAFQQESTGAARAYEGSGLGLAITHQLTDLMGGTIDVQSTKGEGTCFSVRLPWQMEPVGAASGRTLGSSGA